jgi:hypothetical protein
MDKSLKRQIGFKPATPESYKGKKAAVITPVVKKTKAEVVKILPGQTITMASFATQKEVTAKQVVAWINAHPLFKWGGMCAEIGIHKGNFLKVIQSQEPKLKPEIVAKIVAVIGEYGFNV